MHASDKTRDGSGRNIRLHEYFQERKPAKAKMTHSTISPIESLKRN